MVQLDKLFRRRKNMLPKTCFAIDFFIFRTVTEHNFLPKKTCSQTFQNDNLSMENRKFYFCDSDRSDIFCLGHVNGSKFGTHFDRHFWQGYFMLWYRIIWTRISLDTNWTRIRIQNSGLLRSRILDQPRSKMSTLQLSRQTRLALF